MKNWTISQRLTLGFTCVILITLALGSFAWWRFHGLRKNIDDLGGNSLPSILVLGECAAVTRANMIATQAHMSTESDERMASLEQEMGRLSKRRQELFVTYEKLIVDAEDARLFEEARIWAKRYTERRATVLAMSQKHQKDEARRVFDTEVMPLYENYIKAVQATLDYNNKLGEASAAQGIAAAKSGMRLIVFALIVATVAGMALAWLIARAINGALRDVTTTLGIGAEQTAAAASQVSASSQALAEGASEQAASLEETSASMEEMSSMTKRSAENAQHAQATAVAARDSAAAGASQVETMQRALQAIKTASEEITKILKTIDEIAFQTNILALNAAVEAARAGDAGAGFAVVADEVRALAQRCAAAARETAVKIDDAVSKGQQGVSIGSEVARSFVDIQTRIKALDSLVAEIATATSEQSQGIGQITTAVAQMDKVTQSNASSAEETAAAAEELSSQSDTLKAAVAQLQQLVGGRDATAAARRPDPLRPSHPVARVKLPRVSPPRGGSSVNGRELASRPNGLHAPGDPEPHRAGQVL